MSKGRLYYTVGLPRSGKSFYCDQWCRLHSQFDSDIHYRGEFGGWCIKMTRPRSIVCGDDFRKAIHGHDYLPEAEGIVFAHMDVAARAQLAGGFDVMMDETCTTQSTLLRYLKLDPNATPVFINTPKEVCIERAKASGKDYLIGPIERMAAQLKELRADWDNIVRKLLSYVEMRKGLDVAV